MNIFQPILFTVSHVETWIWLPPLVAFIVSFFTSMAGISGAFILLPFQMSVLGYTAPSVSGTNQLFNIIAIPSGVYRYIKEKRMVWPLTWCVVAGTLPGVLIGAWVRIEYLPDPSNFKVFAGIVLCYIGIRLAKDLLGTTANPKDTEAPENLTNFIVSHSHYSLKCIEFKFDNTKYSFSTLGVMSLCILVGIIGGVYGIGGGAIIAPFLITFFRLPVYIIAGATLMGTFITSVAGVLFYQFLAQFYPELSVSPDYALGLLFGLGGFAGMYLGAKCQKYIPA
ncbi:MAG: sulfite exporter TauE/SafE family protein, partial [Spirochaetales bacterium]|nr:sulfite exporter TauE/SafE family protein [Spirochaetales bacterium]